MHFKGLIIFFLDFRYTQYRGGGPDPSVKNVTLLFFFNEGFPKTDNFIYEKDWLTDLPFSFFKRSSLYSLVSFYWWQSYLGSEIYNFQFTGPGIKLNCCSEFVTSTIPPMIQTRASCINLTVLQHSVLLSSQTILMHNFISIWRLTVKYF